MWWSSTLSTSIGRNVPSPTISSTSATCDPALGEPVEQLRREVEPGGRRRRRLGLRADGVDGLVALRVGQRLVDVGRQRHLARRLDAVEQVDLVRRSPARRAARRHRGPRRPSTVSTLGVGRDGAGPCRAAPGGPDAPGPPRWSGCAARAAAPRPLPRWASRSRSRAGSTRVVLTTSRSPGSSRSGRSRTWRCSAPVGRVDQQPGRVAGLDRVLGDARLRQVVVERGGVHGGPR